MNNPYQKIKVAVIGDIAIDHYIFARAIKISSEAPVLVCRKQAIYNTLGCAGNVAANVRGLGAETLLVGVVGNDYFGKKIENIINELHIYSGLIIDKRPTTVKMRILANSQQITRLDTEVETKITAKVREDIIKRVKMFNPNVIIVSDYFKGVISAELLSELRKLGKIIIANPKPQNILCYRNIDVVTLNREEAKRALKTLKNSKLKLDDLRKFLNIKFLIETRGSEGLAIYADKDNTVNQAEQVKVCDVCGAGDSVISIIALEMFLGTVINKIGMLANFGASTVVKQLGTRVIDNKEFFRFREVLINNKESQI